MSAFRQSFVLFLAFGMMVFQIQVASAASADYTATKVGPSITRKNTTFKNQFPVSGVQVNRGVINHVNYQYSFSSRPAGLVVALCHGDDNHCVYVTNAEMGRLDNFVGRRASTPFYFLYTVQGSGAINVRSNQHKIYVDYEIQ